MPHLERIDWDYGDRMQAAFPIDPEATQRPQATYFTYDAGGERVRKIAVNNTGTTARERVYVGPFEVYREYSGLANGNAALDMSAVQLERETLHISDDTGRICLVETQTVRDGDEVGQPANTHRYQLGNHLGSAALELNETANIISYEEYHPYGTSSYRAANSGIDVSPSRYRYTGKERDEETGLYYHGARYYAPWLARWTAPDPIGLGDGVNRFAYVNGQPTVLADTSGRSAAPPEITHGRPDPNAPVQGGQPDIIEKPPDLPLRPKEPIEFDELPDPDAPEDNPEPGGHTKNPGRTTVTPPKTKQAEFRPPPRPQRPEIWGYLPFTSLEDALFDFRDASLAFEQGYIGAGIGAAAWGVVNAGFFVLDVSSIGLGSVAKAAAKASARRLLYAQGGKGVIRQARGAGNKPNQAPAEIRPTAGGGARELGHKLRRGEVELPESVLLRTSKTDAKGRPFGTPGNPNAPSLADFNPRIYETAAGDIKIGSTLHGTNPVQGGSVSQLSNADLVRFRPSDPISSLGLPGGGLSVTGGHHRLAEIQRRVAAGTLPANTRVRILLHD